MVPEEFGQRRDQSFPKKRLRLPTSSGSRKTISVTEIFSMVFSHSRFEMMKGPVFLDVRKRRNCKGGRFGNAWILCAILDFSGNPVLTPRGIVQISGTHIPVTDTLTRGEVHVQATSSIMGTV